MKISFHSLDISLIRVLKCVTVIALAGVVTSCAADSAFQGAQEKLEENLGQGTTPPGNDDEPPPPDFSYEKPVWEDGTSGRQTWSQKTLLAIVEKSQHLAAGSRDIKNFCPKYASITVEQKANFWLALIAAMAYYESSFEPTKRVAHEGGGTDPLTQLPRYREGLLQITYADSIGINECGFNWAQDQNRLPNDPEKTIFQAEKNLTCAVLLMDRQIASHDRIETDQSIWQSINSDSKVKRVKEIQALTKSLSFCP